MAPWVSVPAMPAGVARGNEWYEMISSSSPFAGRLASKVLLQPIVIGRDGSAGRIWRVWAVIHARSVPSSASASGRQPAASGDDR